MGTMRGFVTGVVVGLAAAAISRELEKPEEERTWHGTVAGVPYNFRVQDWADISREYWNPDSDQILTPHAIGLGWGVNVAALVRHVRALAGAAQDSIAPRQPSDAAPEPIER